MMMMMMMLFICSRRNNNQPNAIYPLGTFHRGLKKAHVMMLPSCPLWYYDDPFSSLVDDAVAHISPTHISPEQIACHKPSRCLVAGV
jgi:hypothetical protein